MNEIQYTIPSTSKVSVDTNYEHCTCRYKVYDKSGKVIWAGFIRLNQRSGVFDHTVNTFDPDIMIVRHLAALGNSVEESFLKKLSTNNNLLTLCEAVESRLLTPAPEDASSSSQLM